MTVHLLKIRQEYYEAVQSGAKRFEVRKNDRAYAVGDLLALMAPNEHQTAFIVRITYILDADQFPEGIKPGYCVLGIEDAFL